jgi:hypothetical protein
VDAMKITTLQINTLQQGAIRNSPNRYINQTVVLLGQYFGEGALGFMGSSGSFPIIIPNNAQKPTPLVSGGTYKFTGIVRYGYVANPLFTTGLYLEVTKIETT